MSRSEHGASKDASSQRIFGTLYLPLGDPPPIRLLPCPSHVGSRKMFLYACTFSTGLVAHLAQVLPHALQAKNVHGKTAADLSHEYHHKHVAKLLQTWKV